eukprot:CAMPEP_0206137200 /NCGR_PEP_ID=MMETSP1473-20131121/2365_1 /ASSEMBLY_ACC=CAM_ASM_001109 /TAXON_ID=1461547 /ORGANISM="Stichococcus sp, Strain RCC1054" /LENGTH=474 /DNA_ID=CAMNT_0053530173 /DNA_START=226 /DNA_END=1650 /DNA_ORIENTATION=-
MPQTFHAVLCYSCASFSVQQVKKVPKWTCARCGEKQSLQQVFAISEKAKDVREVVATLNARRSTSGAGIIRSAADTPGLLQEKQLLPDQAAAAAWSSEEVLGGSCRDDCFDVGRALEHEDGVFLGLESGSSDLGDADRHGNTEGRCEGNEAGTRWQVYIEPDAEQDGLWGVVGKDFETEDVGAVEGRFITRILDKSKRHSGRLGKRQRRGGKVPAANCNDQAQSAGLQPPLSPPQQHLLSRLQQQQQGVPTSSDASRLPPRYRWQEQQQQQQHHHHHQLPAHSENAQLLPPHKQPRHQYQQRQRQLQAGDYKKGSSATDSVHRREAVLQALPNGWYSASEAQESNITPSTARRNVSSSLHNLSDSELNQPTVAQANAHNTINSWGNPRHICDAPSAPATAHPRMASPVGTGGWDDFLEEDCTTVAATPSHSSPDNCGHGLAPASGMWGDASLEGGKACCSQWHSLGTAVDETRT